MIRDEIESVKTAFPRIVIEQPEHLTYIFPKFFKDEKLTLKAKLNELGK
jgi:hypothetical protein